jgi:histidinol-phosphate aminotransferase
MNLIPASWHAEVVQTPQMPDGPRVRLRQVVQTLPAYVPGARPTPGEQLWKLSSNENPYPPLPSVLDVIAQAARDVNRYPDVFAGGVAEALAGTMGVASEQVVVGNGSVAVLSHIIETVVDGGPEAGGDEVIFPWRSFEAYPIAVAIAGGAGVRIPLAAGGRLDLPAMAAAVTDRTRLILVCSPNNPTGPVVHAAELAAFLAAVPPDVLVVLDEAYLEFVRDPDVPDGAAVLRSHDNVVLLRTLSKAYGLAGLRVGYAVAHPRIAAGIRAVSTPFGVSGIAQAAAIASLAPAARPELAARVDALVAERSRVTTALRVQGWDLPDAQGNFVWFEFAERTIDAAAQARAAGVIVRPFAGEGLRVTIGEPEANDALIAIAHHWREGAC